MCIHDEYFAQLCCHPKIISMATELLGPDVKLLQSMAILKPPGDINTYIIVLIIIYRLCSKEVASGQCFPSYHTIKIICKWNINITFN